MEKPWKVVFAFICVFMAGAVFGGFFTLRDTKRGEVVTTVTPPPVQTPGAAQRPPAPPVPVGVQIQPAIMRQFTQRLRLTVEQREKIKPVVAHATEELQRLRRENLQDTTRVMETMYADVAASLTPEQRAELEDMKRKMQERVAAEKRKRDEEDLARKAEKRPKKQPTS
jgi:Spy/CpxP family protein refolding chaperone